MSAESFIVEGGHKLKGDLHPQGAKNEALQILCAVMMTDEEVVIENIPLIADIHKLMDLLAGLGVSITEIDEHTYKFQAKDIDLNYMATPEYRKAASRIRGSIMLLGPLLARYKKAFIPKP